MRRPRGFSKAIRSNVLQGMYLSLLWALMSMGTFPAMASAQEASQDSYAGFEGRKVENVEITAPPTMNAESFRPLIRQKPGGPFSIDAIRESAAALQRTNEFRQVQVSIEPQSSGLRVVFILQPASYIGMISFPEASKAIAYTRLLQAVNVPEQAPFVESQMPEAKQALLHFLASVGYFSATAELETQLRFDLGCNCRFRRAVQRATWRIHQNQGSTTPRSVAPA